MAETPRYLSSSKLSLGKWAPQIILSCTAPTSLIDTMASRLSKSKSVIQSVVYEVDCGMHRLCEFMFGSVLHWMLIAHMPVAHTYRRSGEDWSIWLICRCTVSSQWWKWLWDRPWSAPPASNTSLRKRREERRFVADGSEWRSSRRNEPRRRRGSPWVNVSWQLQQIQFLSDQVISRITGKKRLQCTVSLFKFENNTVWARVYSRTQAVVGPCKLTKSCQAGLRYNKMSFYPDTIHEEYLRFKFYWILSWVVLWWLSACLQSRRRWFG